MLELNIMLVGEETGRNTIKALLNSGYRIIKISGNLNYSFQIPVIDLQGFHKSKLKKFNDSQILLFLRETELI